MSDRTLFAVFDTETTGLTSHFNSELEEQPRIIEFGGILTDGEEIIDQLEFVCDPGIAIEEIITKITGLTNEDLSNELPFSTYLDKVKAFFAPAKVVIAHNLSFDRDLLKYDLQRCGKELADVNFPPLLICTVEQTMHQFGRRMKLSELYEQFCGPYVQKHRALDDVLLLNQICKKMGVYDALSAA